MKIPVHLYKINKYTVFNHYCCGKLVAAKVPQIELIHV